jgi:predicted SAM-dependent methyltransferase
MNYLNLGCGNRTHPAWINIDCTAANPTVLIHDLRNGIPFPDEDFDVVYHSHLLEHIPRSSVPHLLEECYRVLKPNGMIRVAVPDLEEIAKAYLQTLEGALEGDQRSQENYEWMMLELYDQTIREYTAGELGSYLTQENIPNKEFVLERIGVEARQAFAKARSETDFPRKRPTDVRLRQLLRRLYRFLRDATVRREAIIRRVLRTEYELLQLGRFRRSGEIHLWMYDQYSLGQALLRAGFRKPELVSASESHLPGWTSFNLDTEPDGTVYKPDSLFMEAFK